MVNLNGQRSKQLGVGAVCNVPTETLTDVQNGRRHLYITSRAIYRDKFDNSYWHVSEFCVKINNISGDLNNPASSLRFVSTPCTKGHNCHDEECENEALGRPEILRGYSVSSAIRAERIEAYRKARQNQNH